MFEHLVLILVSFVVVIVSGTNLDAAQYIPVTCFVTSLVPVYIEITLAVFSKRIWYTFEMFLSKPKKM